MSILSSIGNLELVNFRCYPDGRIGPFKRFNLLYGRNGSGKTSLLEAIEVGITSDSSRRQKGDDLDVLARNKEKALTISVSSNSTHEINRFEYIEGIGRGTHSQSALLGALYKLTNVDGRRARHLLPQLFRTQNILYADRIVQFLHASEKREIKRVFSELTMGTAPVEIWERIMLAIDALRRLHRDTINTLQDLDTRAQAIKDEMATFQARDHTHLKALSEQFAKDLPDTLKDRLEIQLQELQPSRQVIIAIRSISLMLKNAAKEVRQLRILADVHDVEITESNLRTELLRLRESKKLILGKKDKSRKELERMSESIRAITRQVRKLKPSLEERAEARLRLRTVLATAQDFIGWIPELAADEKMLQFDRQETRHERRRRDLSAVIEVVRKLPTNTYVETLKEKRRQLQEQTKSLRNKCERYHDELEKYREVLAASDERLAIRKAQNTRMYELVSRLAQTVAGFDVKDSGVDCPLCGSHWEERTRFMAAVRVQLASFSEGFDAVELEKRSDTQKACDQLSDAISRETKRLKAIQDDVRRVENELEVLAEKTAAVVVLCENVGLSEDRVRVLLEDPKALGEWLHLQLQETHSVSSSLRRARRDLWKGLRQPEYEYRRNTLRKKLTELANEVAGLELLMPDGWEASEWKKLVGNLEQLQTGANQKWVQTKQELWNAEARLANRHSSSENLRLELAALEGTNDDVTRRLETISGAQKALVALRDSGFVKSGRRIIPRIVEDTINQACITVVNLMSELETQLHKEHSLTAFQQQLREVIQEREKKASESRRCTATLKKLAQVPSLQAMQREVWRKYSDAIASMFRKLHWPPDYENVVVDEQGDGWELLLARRLDPKMLVAAHQQMSSGQRAALAISVFWTFNTAPNVPSVLLMDEPIQNIDDLNMLNFLDGLRWLIEDSDRQVFVTTANRRVGTLVRKKFSYLQEGYLEINLSRGAESLTRLKYYDWNGQHLDSEAEIA